MDANKRSVLLIAGAAGILALLFMRKPAETVTTIEGEEVPTAWDGILANGGVNYNEGDILYSINPDITTRAGLAYMPLFGFVAISTPDALNNFGGI